MHHCQVDESIQGGLRCTSGLWAVRIHLVLTPLPMPLRIFSRYLLFTLTGAVGAADLCPGRHGLGSCRNIDERMQGSVDALGVVIFCDLRQSEAP